MTSQISGPCCDSDTEPDQYKVLYGKVTFANNFDNIIPENNQRVPRQRWKKTVQMSDIISHAVSLLWVKLCYSILLRNVWRVGLQSC